MHGVGVGELIREKQNFWKKKYIQLTPLECLKTDIEF